MENKNRCVNSIKFKILRRLLTGIGGGFGVSVVQGLIKLQEEPAVGLLLGLAAGAVLAVLFRDVLLDAVVDVAAPDAS